MSYNSIESGEQVDVLIVGGGPAGLSTALSLHHFSASHRANGKALKVLLVDALSHGQNESRALIIHARTMEALETIGCASTLAALGIQSQNASLLSAISPESAGSRLATMDFSLLKGRTQFPYGLLIPQHVTERGLSDILGEAAKGLSANGILHFVRGLRMSGMKEEAREIDGSIQNGFLVTFEGGKSVWTRYLVGADGSRSTVRTLSQIAFEDPSPTSNSSVISNTLSKVIPSPVFRDHICLADLIFEEDFGKRHKGLRAGPTITIGTEGFFLFCPIKLVKSDRERYVQEVEDGRDDDGSDKYWYRIAFLIPPEEYDLSKSVLLGNKGQNGQAAKGSESDPAHRDTYQSTSEALEYLQGKLHSGARYIPRTTGDPEDLPISPKATVPVPRIKRVVWASTFRVRYALANTFHKAFTLQSDGVDSDTKAKAAHVLLVGDAGHIHSPAGGQGMNLGIRDGIECGKAISEHLFDSPSSSTPSDPDAPLEKFASSRKAMGLETITLTKRLTWVASMQSGSLVSRMRNTFLWLVGLTEFVRRRLVSELSGFGKD